MYKKIKIPNTYLHIAELLLEDFLSVVKLYQIEFKVPQQFNY